MHNIRIISILVIYFAFTFSIYSQCKYDTAIAFSFDLNKLDEKILSSRNITIRNSNGMIEKSISEVYNSNTQLFENKNQTIYVYDSKNNLIEINFIRWKNGNWVSVNKSVSVFDSNNNKIEFTQYTYNDSARILLPTNTSISEYSSSNKIIEENTLIWDISKNDWVWHNKRIYNYDQLDSLMSKIDQYWNVNSSLWINHIKLLYIYTSSPFTQEIGQLLWNLNSNKWELFSTEFLTYNEKTLLINRIGRYWDNSTQQLINTYNIQNKYNSDGLKVYSETEFYDNQSKLWNKSESDTFIYNDEKYLSYTLHKTWDMSLDLWNNFREFFYSYNSNNKIFETITRNWNLSKNIWTNWSRTKYEYSNEVDLKAYETENWDSNEVLLSKNRIEFTCYQISKIKEISTNVSFLIYPNPITKGMFQIESTKNSNYSIFDLNGELLDSGKIFIGKNEISITPKTNQSLLILGIGGKNMKIINFNSN